MSLVPDRWTRGILHGLRNYPQAVDPHPLFVPSTAGPNEWDISYQAGCDVEGCTELAVWHVHAKHRPPLHADVTFAVDCPRHPMETAP